MLITVPVVSGPLLGANGEPNLPALNAHLYTRSYINGYQPSQQDVKIYEVVGKAAVDLTPYPHLSRWVKHLGAFSGAERSAWK